MFLKGMARMIPESRWFSSRTTCCGSAPFITRRIPYYEVLDEEGLATIERNADTILEETGIDFRDDAEALVEELGADEGDVTPQARLQADLNAESIDFLAIPFRLERVFGIQKIDRGDLFPESIFQGDPEFVKDGKVTAKGLAELREKMPYADLSTFEKNPTMEGIGDLFTVNLIVSYIESKLAARAKSAA